MRGILLSLSEKGDDMVDPSMAELVGADNRKFDDGVKGHGDAIQTIFKLHRRSMTDFIEENAV